MIFDVVLWAGSVFSHGSLGDTFPLTLTHTGCENTVNQGCEWLIHHFLSRLTNTNRQCDLCLICIFSRKVNMCVWVCVCVQMYTLTSFLHCLTMGQQQVVDNWLLSHYWVTIWTLCHYKLDFLHDTCVFRQNLFVITVWKVSMPTVKYLQRVRAVLRLGKPPAFQQVMRDIIRVDFWIRAGSSGQHFPHEHTKRPLKCNSFKLLRR